MKRRVIPLLIVLTILVLLLFIRAFSPIEIDDVHPGISCEPELLQRSDVLWVVPLFENDSILNHPQWCSYIKSLNKTLGLHGVYHSYNEFAAQRDDAYLKEGIKIFESCLNITPTIFKAPQIAFNESNFEALWKDDLESRGKLNQLFHKVYHCDDTGEFPNWFIRLF
jgi:predicted deacetylase